MKTFEEYLEKMGYSWNDFDRTYEMENLIEKYADEKIKQALPIQNIMASVSDELLLRAGKYEDEANADFDTDGVQHNLNIGRYDGLMQAVQELNKHLP